MKTIILACLLLLVHFSFAALPSEMLSQLHHKSEVFEPTKNFTEYRLSIPDANNCPKYQKLKKTGFIMLCVGAPIALVGISCIIAGTALTINGNFNALPLYAIGSIAFVGGLGVTGAGTALYIIGKVKSKKYCGGTSLQLNSSQNGLGFAYNF